MGIEERIKQHLIICPRCGEIFGSQIPYDPSKKEVCVKCQYPD